MKKGYWLIAAVLVVVLALGYAYKHQIKVLLMGAGTSPTTSSYNYSVTPTTSPSAPSSAVGMFQSGTNGNYLVAANGMTLYTFDKDAPNTSNCTGTCASNWPAYVTNSAPSSLPDGMGTFTRTDGKVQYTWNKMPLYYYAGDNMPGDIKGDGVNGVWHIVKQ